MPQSKAKPAAQKEPAARKHDVADLAAQGYAERIPHSLGRSLSPRAFRPGAPAYVLPPEDPTALEGVAAPSTLPVQKAVNRAVPPPLFTVAIEIHKPGTSQLVETLKVQPGGPYGPLPGDPPRIQPRAPAMFAAPSLAAALLGGRSIR